MKNRNIIHVIWFPVLIILVFFSLFGLFGPGPALYVTGVIFLLAAIMPFLTFIRTHNSGYLAVTMYIIFLCLICLSTPPAINDNSEAGLLPLFLAIMYGLMLVVAYLGFNRKLRFRGEEIFELAALPIEDTGESFSARPRPTGQVPISKTEMIRFVDFVTRHLIAFPFQEDNRVVFVLALPGKDTPYLLGLKKNYLEDTWVAIGYEGNISVNITEGDYLLFKMDLDFDQLCQSLGDVFMEFLELSKNGKESQIIDRMNALRLNPFL
ncbi:MAG: hypothetical protein E4H33_00425 [Anaerolineales bacterium]|nr:MAG: hypothetical protein E4H33_00425 [Anaerolineales bacterium]